MNWQTKYITEEGVLNFYNQHMVKEINGFFESTVKKRIREARAEDQQFNKVITESNKKKRPVVANNYSEMYDYYCNYARYILEKTSSLDDMLSIAEKYYPYVERERLIDLVVVIVASYIRSKMSSRV